MKRFLLLPLFILALTTFGLQKTEQRVDVLEERAGDMLVGASGLFAQNASVQLNLEVMGTYASVSGNLSFGGELLPDGATCSNGQILKRTAANDWDCAADNSGGGGGTQIEIRDIPGLYDTNTSSLSFDGGKFTLTASGSAVAINLDWGAGGPASLSQNETITGNWVNTANPWADNEVVDTLTINGGTVTWTDLTSYPTGCTNQFVTTIGDTLTCASVAAAAITNDVIDFPQIADSLTIDANTSIASAGFTFSFGSTDVTLTLARLAAPTYSTLQHFQNFAVSPGVVSGGVLTTASGLPTQASVSAGSGWIKATDSNTAEVLWFDWPASNSFVIPTDTVRYIGIKYNAGVPKVTAKTTDTWDLDTEFPVGIAVNEGGVVSVVANPWTTGDTIANIFEVFDSNANIHRDEREGGLIPSNAGTRNVAVTAGALLSRVSEFSIAAIDTSTGSTFTQYHRDGAGGWTASASTTKWDNTLYDDGDGTMASIGALQYTSRWFYVMTDGSLALVMGQSQDLDLADIIAEAPPATVPNRVLKGGILIGRFIIRASGTTPAVTQSAFGTAFTAATVTDHGSLSGLADDDHTQYLLLAGRSATQAISNNLTLTGSFVISSELSVGGPGQFGGTATLGYSRFGTPTTGHSLDAANDLIIGDDFEVDGDSFFDGQTTIGVLLGAVDAGGATSFELPNGTGPTINAEGEIAIDTSGFGQLVYFASGSEHVLSDEKSVTLSIASSSFNTFASRSLGYLWRGRTIKRIVCKVSSATSVVINLSANGTSDLDQITCAATNTFDDGSLANATLTKGSDFVLERKTVTGEADFLTITFTYVDARE